MSALKNLERICVLRLSAIGDVCHTLPVVRSLQRAYPTAKITWIIGKLEATLLGDIPGIEFIIFDKQGGWREHARVGALLKGRDFDVLLHMQVALRSSLLSLRIPAKTRVGFDRARARDYQWLFTNKKIAVESRQHVMDGLFGFARAIGVQQKEITWDIPIPDADRDYAEKICGSSRPLVISPCSSQRLRNFRNWNPVRFAEVADYASSKFGLQIILSGGPGKFEHDFAAHIEKTMTGSAINLVGKTSLKQVMALLNHSTALIAPDSGPLHMANAMGTPAIGLYATSNPARTGPYNFQNLVVNCYPLAVEKFMNKSETEVRWGQRVRDPAAMELIASSAVKEKLDQLMANQSTRP